MLARLFFFMKCLISKFWLFIFRRFFIQCIHRPFSNQLPLSACCSIPLIKNLGIKVRARELYPLDLPSSSLSGYCLINCEVIRSAVFGIGLEEDSHESMPRFVTPILLASQYRSCPIDFSRNLIFSFSIAQTI